MQIQFPKSKIPDPVKFIRRLGYGVKNWRGEVSYVRHPVRGSLYPRFHLYVADGGDGWQLNLHLDQKAPVYEGQTAHAGEYEGGAVEIEGERIRAASEQLLTDI